MNRESAITIDIGTTNCKVSLFHVECRSLQKRVSFKTPKLQDEFGELFDFENLWNQLISTICKITKDFDVDSIIISSVGEAGMLVNHSGQCIGPMIAWYDKRSAGYIEQLSEEDKEKIYSITGLPAHSNYGISKIKWLCEHYVDHTCSDLIWMALPDLIVYRLTGIMKSEYSIASRTMCFDLKHKEWSHDILDMFQLTGRVRFPDVVSAGKTIATISEHIHKAYGISREIQVCIAGHDHMVGAQAIHLQKNQVLNSTGTTEGILYLEDNFDHDMVNYRNALANGIYTDPNCHTLFSSIPTGGIAIEWLKNIFHITDEEFDVVMDKLRNEYFNNELKKLNQLLVIPHLNGSGAPYKNTDAKALLYGLTMKTTKEDIIFSFLLGLGFEFRHVMDCFPRKEMESILVIGPVAKNSLWLQIKADVLQKEIIAVQADEAVSLGALQLVYPRQKSGLEYKVFYPDVKKKVSLDHLFKVYEEAYDQIKKLEAVENGD